MLAQNFKTPKDLKITDAEFEALAKIMRMLERGELRHVNFEAITGESHGFNMSDYEAACGTVCCIAGWCDRLFKTSFVDASITSEISSAMDDLFHMEGFDLNQMNKVTSSQAAIAIRNYLTHGEPRWAEAIGG